jgi:protein-disulfide isomerase
MSFARIILISGLSLALSACVTRGDIEEIKANQKEILEKIGKAPARQPPRQRPRGPDPKKVYSMSVDGAPIKGPADAWVTIVEVSDFQCPYCKRVTPTLKQLEEKYGSDVRFAFKHNPLSFHNRAKPASNAAACAGEQGKFWQMHDQLFENQRQLEDANFEQYAGKIGVDVGKWKSCYSSKKYEGKITGDQRQVVSLGARGTPAFFINGRFLSGAQPLPAFQALVDEELAKAKKSGIAKADYYKKAVVEKGSKAM